MYIPIILGTARQGRQSEKAAVFMLHEAKSIGLKTEIIDVRDLKDAATDNTIKSPFAKAFAEKIAKADGLIIVSPEYNHSYPGELKLVLDMLYKQYARKPVGFCGVSAGPLGGVRAVEQLRLVAVELQMAPIREAVYFANACELFDGENAIKDRAYHDRAKNFLEELVWYARALKEARES